jgi:hypothetical protein
MKEAAIPPIAAHITSTIEDFKAANAELRPQSPSLGNICGENYSPSKFLKLDETHSDPDKDNMSYHDSQHTPSEPMDLPSQPSPDKSKVTENFSLKTVQEAERNESVVVRKPAADNFAESASKKNVTVNSSTKSKAEEEDRSEEEEEIGYLSDEGSSGGSRPQSPASVADEEGEEEAKPGPFTPLIERSSMDHTRHSYAGHAAGTI